MCKVLRTQHRTSYGQIPQGYYSSDMGKYTNVIQHAKWCTQLYTGVLGAEAKGPQPGHSRKTWEGFPQGWDKQNVEERAGASSFKSIPWVHSTVMPLIIPPGFELRAFTKIIPKSHDLNPEGKPLLSWIYSRSGKAKTTQALIPNFPPYA